VLLAAGYGWLAWRISATRVALSETVSRAAIARGHFVNLVARVEKLGKESPVSLAAEVAALSEAVERLRATQRRFQGRFDQYMGQGEGRVDDSPDDPKWRALMQLQTQGRPNGGV